MNAFKRLCITLRHQDHTLPEIMKITGRPKTSVLYHIRDIPLSADKQIQIRKASGQRAMRVSLRRKGKSARAFEQFARWTPATVSLVAHMIFDGEINHASCIYNNRNIALLRTVEEAMRTIYGYEPSRYRNPVTGVSRIAYHNVALSAYIMRKATELLEDVPKLPLNLKREFVRSFFDDEGCMDFRPQRNVRQIRGYQKHLHILNIVKSLLADLGIDSRLAPPNEIVISGREHLCEFENKIGFTPGVRINGRRPNSIWRKSLEKRALLRRALSSYQVIQ